MRVEGIMVIEDNYNLLVEILQDNYGDKIVIKNVYCVVFVIMVKLQYIVLVLCIFYDSFMSDMRFFVILDFFIIRYGDFYVLILFEKFLEKLLISVLKEYLCVNFIID